jgi:hypothetical protein
MTAEMALKQKHPAAILFEVARSSRSGSPAFRLGCKSPES